MSLKILQLLALLFIVFLAWVTVAKLSAALRTLSDGGRNTPEPD